MPNPRPVDHTATFDADHPETRLADDQFDRAAFGIGVASSIAALPVGQCFVIGIHGPWGDGKTTVLNFIADSLSAEHSIITTWYNPWRYINEDVMLAGLFSTLASAVRLELKTKGEKLAAAIASYGQYVAPADDRLGRAAEIAAKKSEPPVEILRERLREGLSKLSRRIVVFIDDIDRLDADETAAVFRLIKACADFPNVVYVLAFDRDLVAASIGNRLAGGDQEAGRKFLEKIIQVPLMLPPASPADLARACQRGIEEILRQNDVSLTDAESLRWHWAFQEGIARRLRTPRSVVHYLNALRFAFPMLAREVNTVDLLLVEALRVFYCGAYEAIRTHQREFIGVPVGEREQRHGHSPQDDLLAAARDGLDTRTKEALDKLIEHLFPRYHVGRRGSVLGSESIQEWTHQQRVCAPAYGSRYFSYAIGSSDVADKDVDAIVIAADAADASGLRPLLEQQLVPLKQWVLVQKLEVRCPVLLPRTARRLAVAIATLSDRFDEPFSLQDTNHAGVAAATLAARLCERGTGGSERFTAFEELVQQAAEMWFVARFMTRIDPQHPNPEHPAWLEPEQLTALRRVFCVRLQAFLRHEPTLLDLERRWKFEMLFVWARAAGREVVHERFMTRMRSDGNVPTRLLQCLTQPLSRSGEIIPSPGPFEAADLDELSLLVDVDTMAELVIAQDLHKQVSKDPSEWPTMRPDHRLVSQFLHYHALRKRAMAPAGARSVGLTH